MRILLPPSETKRSGGTGAPIELSSLRLPQLQEQRKRAIDALVALSADEDSAARVLKLSERQRGEIRDNAQLWTAKTMPAMDRYTGVLFDALGASELSEASRLWLSEHVYVHSAPFGPIGAGDPIPTYRLGAGISVPNLGALTKLWNAAVTEALVGERFVLDLRSEAYVKLGQVPPSVESVFLRVVTRTAEGETRALNHFNKHAKGDLVRALAESAPEITSAAEFALWAQDHDFTLIRPDSDSRAMEWMLVTR